MKNCIRCNTYQSETAFYKRGNSFYGECKVCMNTRNIVRLSFLKKKLVNYKGGCCEYCGYSKNLKALHFHHIDPCHKAFNLSKRRNSTFNELKEEVDKCILLCANCHAEIHDEQLKLSNTINQELYEILLNEYNLPYYGIVNHTSSKFCMDCGVSIGKRASRCLLCDHKRQERIDWPSKEQFASLLASMSKSKIAKQLGVSDTAIRKRAQKLGLL